MDIKRKPYYNHYLLAYHVLVCYINEYILILFVSKLPAPATAVRRVGERFTDFGKTSFRESLPEIKSLCESWEPAVTES